MNDLARQSREQAYLFVYGTLMGGFGEDLLKKVGAKSVGRGTIQATLYDLGDYPGAKVNDGGSGNRVKGELYRLTDADKAFRTLDEYEEFFPQQAAKSQFVRKLVPVTLESGGRRSAWAYFYNRPVDRAKLVPSGDYRDAAPGRP